MADSFIDFGTTGELDTDQIAGTFDNLSLDYVSTADFYVTVTNGVTKTAVASSDLTVTTSPTLKVVIANPSSSYSIDADSLIRIGRTTGIASAERVYSDGSVLKAKDLNVSFKQVLFGIQEQIDGGLGSIPTDTDDKLNAGGKILKNLGTPVNANDAVTKDYVVNLALTGTGEPQNWSFNFNDQATSSPGDAWTVSGNDLTRVLTSPVPVSANDHLYLIEVGGVLQDPDDAYTIVEVSGEYTLTVIGAFSDGYQGQNISVNVRNWGTVRNELLQPFTQETDAADKYALELKNKSADAAGDLIRFTEHDGNTLGKVTEAGKLQLPEVSSVTGDLKVSSNIAVRNSADDGDLFKVDQTAGSTTVSGPATFSGASTFSDVLNITGSLKKNGANIMGLKAIADRTSTSTFNVNITSVWMFIDRQLKLVKETTNYSEGDYFIMTYNIPVWQNASSESSLMNIVLNTTSSSVEVEQPWTAVESEVVFGSSNMVTKVLGSEESDGTSGVRSTGDDSSHGHVGTVVYQISAEDAAKSELTFDIIMVAMNNTPSVYTTYGSIFTGFLVG